MLSHFEGERVDDLNEAFDGIARNPQEFLGWLLAATGRVPPDDRLPLAAEVAVALYGYIVAEFDDDVIRAAEDCVDAVLDFKDRRKLLRRNPHACEHDASSPFSFFASRAVEDAHDAQEVHSP